MMIRRSERNARTNGDFSEFEQLGRSRLWVVPLAVLLVAAILAGLALRRPASPAAASDPYSPAPALSAIFTPEVQFWSAPIAKWSTETGIDANLIASIMQVESCGAPWARSPAGAIGLFQVMPYHFTASDDPFAPDTNAARGLEYLRKSLAAANGDAGLALAGYNAGVGILSNPEWSWPEETQRYRYWAAGIYADAADGAAESARLSEWLAVGGRYLCATARQSLGLQD